MAEEVRFRIDADDDTGPGVASAISHLETLQAAERKAAANRQKLKKEAIQQDKEIERLERAHADAVKHTSDLEQKRASNYLRWNTATKRAKDDELKAEQDLQKARERSGAIERELAQQTVEHTRIQKAHTAEKRAAAKAEQGLSSEIRRTSSSIREQDEVIKRSTRTVKEHTHAWNDFDKLVGNLHRPIDLGRAGVRPSNLAIGGAVTGLLALGRPLESLLGLLAAVPAAAGAAGIAFASIKALDVGTITKAAATREKYDKQLKAGLVTQKQYDAAVGKAMLTLSQSEVQGLSFYTKLHEKVQLVKKDIQHELIPALADLGHAMQANEKTIRSAVVGGAGIEAQGLTQFSKYLSSRGGQGDLAAFGRTSKLELAGATQGTKFFLEALLSLNRTAEPMIAKLTGDFVGMTARFNAWVRTASGRNSLEKFFQDTERSTVGLFHVLKNVSAIFHDIFNAGSSQSMGFLQWLDQGTNRMDNWLKTARGQKEIGEVWKGVAGIASAFADDLKTLLPVLADVAKSIADVTRALHDLAGAFPGGQKAFSLLLAARLMGGAKLGSFVFGGARGAYAGAAGGAAAKGAAAGGVGALEGGLIEGGAMAAAQTAAKAGVGPGLKAAATRVAGRLGLLGGLAVGALLIYELNKASNSGGPSPVQQALTGIQAKAVQQNTQRQAYLNARSPMAIADLSAQRDTNFIARSQLRDQIDAERAQIRSGFSGGAKGVGDKLSGRDKLVLRAQLRLDRHELDALQKDGIDIKAKLKVAKDPLRPPGVHPLGPDDDHHAVIVPAVPGSIQNILNQRPGGVAGPRGGVVMPKMFTPAQLKSIAAGLDEVASSAKGVDANTSNAAAAASELIKDLGRMPTKKEVEIEMHTNAAKVNRQMTDIENRRLHVGATISVDAHALDSVENRRLTIGAHIQVDNPGAVSSVNRYAGGPINKPMAIVGEQAPTHPEWVIATNPAYRAKNKEYLAQAAASMGGTVTYHAAGGILFGKLPPTGYGGGEDPVPSRDAFLKELLKDTKGAASLTSMQATYAHLKNRNRDEQLAVRKLREKASHMASGPAKKHIQGQIQHLTTVHRVHLNQMSKLFEKIQKAKQADFLSESPYAGRFGSAVTALRTAEQVAITTGNKTGWDLREGQELSLTQERLATLQQMMGMKQFRTRMGKLSADNRHTVFDVLNSEMGDLSSSIAGLKDAIKGGFAGTQPGGSPSSDLDKQHNLDLLAELADLARRGLTLEDVSKAEFSAAVKYLQTQGSFAAGGSIHRTGMYQLHAGEQVVSRSQVNHYHQGGGGAQEIRITGEGPLTNMLAKAMTPVIEQKLGSQARLSRRMGVR